jgi:DNA-binding transcriptional MocR family regulator
MSLTRTAANDTLAHMETISFARGVPAPECLPVEELADCARAAVLGDGAAALSYGQTSGYVPLREWVAERHGTSAGRVMLTNGGLEGFAFFAQALCKPGSRVLTELPTYDRPLKLMHGLGVDVEQLPMDDEGLDPDAFAEALARGPKPAFLYTIPTFQNPSGRTLSVERRHRIGELPREHDVLVLEDDPYGEVRFEGEAPPTMFSLDDGVAYTSSFSKTIAPGLRVGYFIMPPSILSAVEGVANGTYISPPFMTQATVHEFLRRGNFEPNLERVRSLLGARRDAMLEALDREFAGRATWSRPEGGYFVWLEAPGVALGNELLSDAADAGVVFVPGADFGGAPSSARLAYSFVSLDESREGVARLAALTLAAAPAV